MSAHRPPERATPPEVGALTLPMLLIVEWGLAAWAVALALTLLVPALHEPSRAWWPSCCFAGLVLGAIGWLYLRRGRGNAAEARGPDG